MDVCQEKCIHADKVNQSVQAMPPLTGIRQMADIFKALGDPSRLKIVLALHSNELCVCDIAAVCMQSESAVSHQLRLLRALKVVRYRREGKIVFYSLDDAHVMALITQSLDHVAHLPENDSEGKQK